MVGVGGSVTPQYVTHMANLVTNLTTDYSTDLRPDEGVEVAITLGIMHITSLDIVARELQIGAFIKGTWFDARLAWNDADFGNIYQLIMNHHKIWTPPLLLSNAGDGGIRVLNDDSSFDSIGVRLFDTGSVLFLLPVDLTSQCSVNVQYYPFDYQICTLTITSWMYASNEVELYANDDSVNTEIYEENGEWDLHSTFVENGTKYLFGYPNPSVNFNFRLSRNYQYYLTNLILPVIILATMGPFAFIIPMEKGGKEEFSMTIMLSLSVVIGTVAGYIPTTASSVCLLSVYLLVTFVICAMETLANVFSCRIHTYHGQGYTPGSRSNRLFRFLAKITFYKRTCDEDVDEDSSVTSRPQSVTKGNKVSDINRNDQQVSIGNIIVPPKYGSEEKAYTFVDYVTILDRVYFVLFSVINAVVTLDFMITLATAASFDQ